MNSNSFREFDNVTRLPLFNEFLFEVENILIDNMDDEHYALVSTDVSNFKFINHLYGYDKSNELLQNVARVLTEHDTNIISCRTHSDHFISMFRFDGSKEEFVKLVEQYSKKFVTRNARQFDSITLHLNNGIYFLNNNEKELNYSIDKANMARRNLKGNYSSTSITFADDMMCRKEEDAKIINLFDNEIRTERIRIFFQPKVDIVSHKVKGAEALSRMVDENEQPISPVSFVPVLENTGKVVELDRYVRRHVFATIKEWIDGGNEPVPISVNLSKMDFYEKNLAENIYKEFKKYNIPSEYIEFELTESLFFQDSEEITREVEKLREYGFRVSMDDFGVGYSNLNSLGILPVDIIKFDRGFVRNSITNESSYQIMLSLISVLKKINYDIVCEGIETRMDEKMVFECGCDMAQGFLYDKPIPIKEFERKYILKNT